MSAPNDIPSNAPAVERGVGFFETVLLVDRTPILWTEHTARLLATLERLELPAPSVEALTDAMSAATSAIVAPSRVDVATRERALRVSWLAVGADVESLEGWQLAVSVRAIPAATLGRRGGSHAVTLPKDFVRDTPTVKSTSYLASVLGLRWARRRGCDEGLFTSLNGDYLEGTSTALIAWNAGRPRRPNGGCLPSVTAAAFVGETSERGAIDERDLRAGAIVAGALTLAAPLLTLDGEACAQPNDMLARIRAFNASLVSSGVKGEVEGAE